MADDTNREFELALSLDDVSFKDKTLRDWEAELTIDIPSSHITNQEMQRFLIKLNNRYHRAYNCYNELSVTFTKMQINFDVKKSIVVKEMIRGMRDQAAGRLPAKEVIAEMAISSNDELKRLQEEMVLFEIIKVFFENSKIKLEKSVQIFTNLTMLVNAADKVHYRAGGEPTL